MERPAARGKVEQLSLESTASHLLEECRMVLPGIQALFGFQLIAVFNQGFDDKLSSAEQVVHLAATMLSAFAMASAMAPAALHRMAETREVSDKFVARASRLLLLGMLQLALGVVLDAYLVARIVLEQRAWALACALALAGVIAWLWVLLPLRHRARYSATIRGGSGVT
jgi:hypothetical protein